MLLCLDRLQSLLQCHVHLMLLIGLKSALRNWFPREHVIEVLHPCTSSQWNWLSKSIASISSPLVLCCAFQSRAHHFAFALQSIRGHLVDVSHLPGALQLGMSLVSDRASFALSGRARWTLQRLLQTKTKSILLRFYRTCCSQTMWGSTDSAIEVLIVWTDDMDQLLRLISCGRKTRRMAVQSSCFCGRIPV